MTRRDRRTNRGQRVNAWRGRRLTWLGGSHDCRIEDIPPTRSDPDSLTWKYFGDLRTGMMGVDRRDQNIPGRLPVSKAFNPAPRTLAAGSLPVYLIMVWSYDGDRSGQTDQQIRATTEPSKG